MRILEWVEICVLSNAVLSARTRNVTTPESAVKVATRTCSTETNVTRHVMQVAKEENAIKPPENAQNASPVLQERTACLSAQLISVRIISVKVRTEKRSANVLWDVKILQRGEISAKKSAQCTVPQQDVIQRMVSVINVVKASLDKNVRKSV
jgi:hypothetical protein